MARVAEEHAIASRSPYTLGYMYRNLGNLARARGDEDGFTFFEKALQIAREKGYPSLEAETLVDYAELRRNAGGGEEAEAYLERARELFIQLGAPQNRAKPSAPSPRSGRRARRRKSPPRRPWRRRGTDAGTRANASRRHADGGAPGRGPRRFAPGRGGPEHCPPPDGTKPDVPAPPAPGHPGKATTRQALERSPHPPLSPPPGAGRRGRAGGRRRSGGGAGGGARAGAGLAFHRGRAGHERGGALPVGERGVRHLRGQRLRLRGGERGPGRPLQLGVPLRQPGARAHARGGHPPRAAVPRGRLLRPRPAGGLRAHPAQPVVHRRRGRVRHPPAGRHPSRGGGDARRVVHPAGAPVGQRRRGDGAHGAGASRGQPAGERPARLRIPQAVPGRARLRGRGGHAAALSHAAGRRAGRGQDARGRIRRAAAGVPVSGRERALGVPPADRAPGAQLRDLRPARGRAGGAAPLLRRVAAHVRRGDGDAHRPAGEPDALRAGGGGRVDGVSARLPVHGRRRRPAHEPADRARASPRPP